MEGRPSGRDCAKCEACCSGTILAVAHGRLQHDRGMQRGASCHAVLCILCQPEVITAFRKRVGCSARHLAIAGWLVLLGQSDIPNGTSGMITSRLVEPRFRSQAFQKGSLSRGGTANAGHRTRNTTRGTQHTEHCASWGLIPTSRD